MRFVLRFTEHALKDLSRLEKIIASRIVAKLEFFIQTGNPFKFAKTLSGPFNGLHRFRVGDYRVIFEVSAQHQLTILYILNIKHRKEIYNI